MMNLQKKILNQGFLRADIHNLVERLDEDEEIITLLSKNLYKQTILLDVSDGFLEVRVNYCYQEKSNTYTMGGHVALGDYSTRNLIKIEKEFATNSEVARRLTAFILNKQGIKTKFDDGAIIIEGGRWIDGSGSLYFYFSEEYYVPAKHEAQNAIDLVKYELFIASLTLSALYDSFRILMQDQKSSLNKIIYQHARRYMNGISKEIPATTHKSSSDNIRNAINSLKKGDRVLGINQACDKPQLH